MPGRSISKRVLSAFPALFLGLFLVFSAPAQVIQTWTQHSLAGNSGTNGESSGAVAMDTNYMWVVDNEHEYLRLFQRYPSSTCVDPVYTTNVDSSLNLPDSNDECDLESC